jgi:hypothetical protein
VQLVAIPLVVELVLLVVVEVYLLHLHNLQHIVSQHLVEQVVIVNVFYVV